MGRAGPLEASRMTRGEELITMVPWPGDIMLHRDQLRRELSEANTEIERLRSGFLHCLRQANRCAKTCGELERCSCRLEMQEWLKS